jgi:hypothetical protein
MSDATSLYKYIPEHINDRLLALRDAESSISWEYGLLANEVYTYVCANNLPYTRLEACGYVSYMVDNERAPNTIMRYALVAEKFADKSIRDRYAHLPFSHFELARAFGKQWKKVLDTSSKMMDDNFGRPPSRKKLERKLLGTLPGSTFVPEPSYPIMTEPANLDIREPQPLLARMYIQVSELQATLELVRLKYPLIGQLLAQALLTVQSLILKIEEHEHKAEYAN